ncbi:MAG: metal ABC transporter ATP-binding protein [Candidatus Magasanikbacteria bacterium]|jgi:zinc transport system ATP-binding protein
MSIDHSKNIIEVENVSFSYGDVEVLKNITLDIHQGDYISLIGPNGGGKTTLLKIMLGLIKPESGNVRLFGKKLKDFKDWSKIGYVPQKAIHFDPLFPITVREVVAMGRYGKLGLLKWLRKKDQKIIDGALEQVEMTQYADRLIGNLSSGQQQRVFIARALAGEPEVIFLDEPTVGVDVKTQEEFYSLLTHLNSKLNITLILVSHDVDVVSHEVTEIACLNQTLVYHGEPKKFMKSSYVENFYGKHARSVSHHH